jgi:serine/threonine-protein kinase
MSAAESDIATAIARLREIDLDDELGETISANGAGRSARELPRISIDLTSTLPAKAHVADGTARLERDLEIIATLGEGGMGRVLLARQHSLEREVAVKTLHRGASQREHDALISEGAITGSLEHPGIVPVHALGLDGEDRPVLVMKRVEGVAWTELIADPKHQLAAHLDIFMHVCHAVEFAHSRRIVHRDLKPQNVLIGRHGEIYLADWGLAVRVDRPWSAQPLCGTPGFMAPEMVVGRAVDARTDVYLLGATLHYLLTGTLRHQGVDAKAAILASVESAPFRYDESVPAELAALANRCTAREPDARLESADEVRQAVGDFLAHRSSIELAHKGREKVAELAQMLGAGELGDEKRQQRIETLAVEARFALEQATAQWKENAVAAEGQRALDELLASRRARAAELERFAHDMDPTISSRQRVLVYVALAAAGVALSIAAIVRGDAAITPRELFAQSFGPLVVLVLVSALLRRHVMATAINRRATVACVAMIGGVSLSRGIALIAGSDVPHMIMSDCLLLGVAVSVSSLYALSWAAWTAPFLLAGAVATALRPERAMFWFSLATGIALVLCAILAWKNRASD